MASFNGITARFTGMKEIEQNLKVLREQFGVKTGGVLIRGLRAGAKVVRDEARRKVPDNIPSGWVPKIDFNAPRKKGQRGRMRRFKSWSGLLRTNIIEHAIPTSSARARGRPTVLIRVRNSGYKLLKGAIRFNRPGSSPGWWWWLEFGTSRYPARPFLRPALEAKRTEATVVFMNTVRKEIADLFGKHAPKRAA